jgi:transcription antitermination protein NusB
VRTRTKARQRAVEALFEAEQRSVSVNEVLERNPAVNDYAIAIAKLTEENLARVDEVINTYSSDWPTNRMPAVDRAILRVAVAELIYEKNLNSSVIISEAVEISESLSTPDSGKFINGLLGNIAAIRDTLGSL